MRVKGLEIHRFIIGHVELIAGDNTFTCEVWKVSRLPILIIFLITGDLFMLLSVTDIVGQSPQSGIEDQDRSLNTSEAVYNAFTSKFLGSKNISLTPHQITEEHYIEEGFLSGVGNVTNDQTFVNTYLSDELTSGKGNGIVETALSLFFVSIFYDMVTVTLTVTKTLYVSI